MNGIVAKAGCAGIVPQPFHIVRLKDAIKNIVPFILGISDLKLLERGKRIGHGTTPNSREHYRQGYIHTGFWLLIAAKTFLAVELQRAIC